MQIDKANHEIEVWLRFGLGFMNGGARQFKADLTKLFVAGIEKYWSRSKSDGPYIDGDRYAVKVHAEALNQTDDDTLAFEIYRSNSPDYVRSHNMRTSSMFLNACSNMGPRCAPTARA